jgi:hypothetical protein
MIRCPLQVRWVSFQSPLRPAELEPRDRPAPERADNGAVNIAGIADRLVGLGGTPLPVQFDPTTLATVGVVGYR